MTMRRKRLQKKIVNMRAKKKDCPYLERDIKNRLDRYLRDKSVTQVLIWAEPDGGSSYLLYIGYS